jgi:hypothetical protein
VDIDFRARRTFRGYRILEAAGRAGSSVEWRSLPWAERPRPLPQLFWRCGRHDFLIKNEAKALGKARKRFMKQHGKVFWVLGEPAGARKDFLQGPRASFAIDISMTSGIWKPILIAFFLAMAIYW